MISGLQKWWDAYQKEKKCTEFINYEKELTVCCDKFLFWYPGNEREELIRVKGFIAARAAARQWVRDHPHGKARIINDCQNWGNDYVPV